MLRYNFLSAVFVIIFWCAFLFSAIAIGCDFYHVKSAIFWYRASGLSILVDAIILWCCKG